MKKIVLLLFCFPIYAEAQFLPELIPGYSSPAGFNKPLDPAYVPSMIYQVDFYSLAANQSDLYLNYHYLIETDSSFKLLKQSRYIDNITEYTTYTKYVSNYAYSNNQLSRKYYSNQKLNTNVLVASSIDSFRYENDLLRITDHWSIHSDSGTINHAIGNEYVYDTLNRYIKIAPYNMNIEPGITYAGYYAIDSFTLSDKPAKIQPYTIPVDTHHINSNYTTIGYDKLNRVSCLTRYMRFSNDQAYFRTDSSVYLYSGNKQYPDSILTFTLNSRQNVGMKKIFTYTAAGTISDITTYSKQSTDFIITDKEVYTALLHSGLQKNAIPFTFQIQPNPSQGSFTLVLPETFTKGDVSILNILGETVYRQSGIANRADILTDLKPGIYSISIHNASGQTNKKLVIQ